MSDEERQSNPTPESSDSSHSVSALPVEPPVLREHSLEELPDDPLEDDPERAELGKKHKPKKGRHPVWFVKDVCVEILKIILIVLVLRAYVVQASAVEGQSMEPTLHDGDYLLIERLTASLEHLESIPKIEAVMPTGWIPRIERGDVVVLTSPENGNTELVKRVIAIGGDYLFFYDHQVWVNGKPIEESYLSNEFLTGGKDGGALHYSTSDITRMPSGYQPDGQEFRRARETGMLAEFGVLVPEDCYFVMGDNRDGGASNDSRAWSKIDVDQGPGDGADHLWVTKHHIHGRVLARLPVFWGEEGEDEASREDKRILVNHN